MLSLLGSFAVSFLARMAMDVFAAWQADRAAKAEGRAEAVAVGAQAAIVSIGTARGVEAEAEAAHRAIPSDDAFDTSFRRD